MAPSLRGRLYCFYCGRKSKYLRCANPKSFECGDCKAVNHLDENGEITDPPTPSDILINTRYAQRVQRPSSPVFEVPKDSLFCETCVKNQLLHKESLAAYFPSPDAPDYAAYESAFPKFKKGLDERYPQVCEECEPRVAERIRATGYAAKTDHLRRVIDRTRGGTMLYSGSTWKNVGVFLGGLAWTVSWVGQACWHSLGLLTSKDDYDGLLDEAATISGSSCMQQAIQNSKLPPACTELVKPVALLAVVLGFLSIWWNPRLQEKLQRSRSRMIGGTEYYLLQALLLGARSAVYAFLTQTSSSEQVQKAVHFASLFLGSLLTFMSFRSVRLDYTPRAIFQESPESLGSRRPQQDGLFMPPPQPRRNLYTSQISSVRRPFSINDLAPLTQQPLPYQRPLTPPLDGNDEESMDWTPSQENNFHADSLYRRPNPADEQSQPSPFYGHLPPDVVNPAHKIRNPPNKPTFRKASTKTKRSFFQTPDKQAMRDTENVSDYETGTPSVARTNELSPMKFADPKFFHESNYADTGLETLLATTFSIAEEPAEIRAMRKQNQDSSAGNISVNWKRMLIGLALSVCCLLGIRVYQAHAVT